jgi:hypothetical protein
MISHFRKSDTSLTYIVHSGSLKLHPHRMLLFGKVDLYCVAKKDKAIMQQLDNLIKLGTCLFEIWCINLEI